MANGRGLAAELKAREASLVGGDGIAVPDARKSLLRRAHRVAESDSWVTLLF